VTAQLIIQTHYLDLEEEVLEEEVNMAHTDHCQEEVEDKNMEVEKDLTEEILKVEVMEGEEDITKDNQGIKDKVVLRNMFQEPQVKEE
jgi:hypothetical protein